MSGCYQNVLKSLQCVCLLLKCPLKASQMRGHMNIYHQSVPFLSPNIPLLVNKVSWYILLLIRFLIATEVTKFSYRGNHCNTLGCHFKACEGATQF